MTDELRIKKIELEVVKAFAKEGKRMREEDEKEIDYYSHKKVMARLRKSMGEKRWKSMKGRKGQSLLPSEF